MTTMRTALLHDSLPAADCIDWLSYPLLHCY